MGLVVPNRASPSRVRRRMTALATRQPVKTGLPHQFNSAVDGSMRLGFQISNCAAPITRMMLAFS